MFSNILQKPASDVKLVGSNDSGAEVYKSSSYTNQPLKKTEVPPPKVEQIVEEDDPADAVIAPGTLCLHKGCTASFQGESSRIEECIYHPGIPIFHEGSKGWSCCKAKKLEFDEFIKIEGCKVGKHKFIPPKQVV